MGNVVEQKKFLFQIDMGNVEMLYDKCVENHLQVHFWGKHYVMHSAKKPKLSI